MIRIRTALIPLLLLSLTACEPAAGPTPKSSQGAHPALPAPRSDLLPTTNFATAIGWPRNKAPVAPAGFIVTRFAQGLDHPRWIYILPNGDVLVAESITVPKPPHGFQDRVGDYLQRNTDTVGVSANKIVLLRPRADGTVKLRSTFLSGLNQPFGMALLNGKFYVGNTGGVWEYDYKDGDMRIAGPGKKILDLPVGGYNNHWTRNVFVNHDGTKLFVTVGSGSNAGENGADNDKGRANILEINPDGSGRRVFASGIRNPNGLGYEPQTGVLWTVANERDMLGNDLVPDYLTRVRDGDFYGWPWAYWGHHVDARVTPPRPDMVAKAMTPDYALGAHVAALGLTFYNADAFPAHYKGGAFIGEHGSWNRKPFAGYKVVFVPFVNGMPSGAPEDFLTGFLASADDGTAYGRPVGVTVDKDGALLVADDTGGIIWRVTAKP
ncbi:MAG TPA: sorbosone dehydrogenase family protein [Rhizomicrobium sp.]|jgi:glucose/arabinose dehydrogenase|nr:sorbosone dehydrogenase family protein [Rhizomicrobium sp.]